MSNRHEHSKAHATQARMHIPRARRIGVRGARMRVGRAVADVVNVSRSGVLIRASCDLDAASEWPVILEFNSVLVRVAARVARKEEPAKKRAAAAPCLVALTFIKPSPAVLKDVCGVDRGAATRPNGRTSVRWPRVSFVRCCPNCDSVSIEKRKRRHDECLDCGRRFVGFRIASLRIAI